MKNVSFAHQTLHNLAHVTLESGGRAFLVSGEIYFFGFVFLLFSFGFFLAQGVCQERGTTCD